MVRDLGDDVALFVEEIHERELVMNANALNVYALKLSENGQGIF
jgi:hypothetical protein